MDDALIISKTKEYVKGALKGDSGHDWLHIERVLNNAIAISKKEKGNVFVIQLASLLHDIADWKFNDGNEEIGPELARKWLSGLGVPKEIVNHISSIVRDISFKGAKAESKIDTLEGMIVQDADRLDAIGAIGIARAFTYGGYKNREMYNPNIPPVLHQSTKEYKANISPTINHFYEKLLLLKDLMNTKTAKEIAESRHAYMEEFLNEFCRECDFTYPPIERSVCV